MLYFQGFFHAIAVEKLFDFDKLFHHEVERGTDSAVRTRRQRGKKIFVLSRIDDLSRMRTDLFENEIVGIGEFYVFHAIVGKKRFQLRNRKTVVRKVGNVINHHRQFCLSRKVVVIRRDFVKRKAKVKRRYAGNGVRARFFRMRGERFRRD